MSAKLLLVEDVEHHGRSGDIITVKPGFARNFLLPRGFAVVADKVTLRMQARLQAEREKKSALDKKESEEVADGILKVVLSTIVKVDHDGHMYGSVTAHDILELLQSQENMVLEKRSIALKHPIKTLGVHKIPVKLKEGVTASLTLKVMSKEGQFEEEVEVEKPAES